MSGESELARAAARDAVDRLRDAVRQTRDAFVLVPLEGPEQRVPRASAESACVNIFEMIEHYVTLLDTFVARGPS